MAKSKASAYDIILKPIVSEKAMELSELNKFVFDVNPKANKIEIKNAIEEIFSVKVSKVNKIVTKPKKRRVQQHVGFKRNYTKAIITLTKDSDPIKLFGEE